MGETIKDFLTEMYNKEYDSDKDKKEQIDFYSYMIFKMKELANYSGIDTREYDERFFISELSLYSKFGWNDVKLYSYNKNNDDLNLITFYAYPYDDIFLRKASTSKINLENGNFVYHEFEKPKNLSWEVNIIHKKMNGVLPYHIFNPDNTYNITKGVINRDFNKDILPHNYMYDIHDVIRDSKNKKEYVYDEDIMWEVDPKRNYVEHIKLLWPDLYPIIKDMSLEEAKKVIFKNPSEIEDIDFLIKILELIDYKKRYEEHYKNKSNKALKYIVEKQN